jgi:outer membrane protein assembly factor BamB
LDAATGQVLKTFEQTADADEILLSDGLLIVRRRKNVPDSTGRHTWDTQVRPSGDGGPEIPASATGEQSILAIDPNSGETLWQWPETQMVTLSLAACNGRVCYHNFKEIVCLDLKTGEKLWSVGSPTWPDRMGTAGTLVLYGDMVLYTGDRGFQAICARAGEVQWDGARIIQASPWQPPDLLVADGLIWGGLTPEAADCPFPLMRSPHAAEPLRLPSWRVDEAIKKRMQSPKAPDWLRGPKPKGLNPNTGEVERIIGIGKLITPEHHARCYRSKATDNYLLYNKRGIEFVDIKGGKNHARCNWTRGECFYGVMPANGLVYVPPHPCACYLGAAMNGFLAYSSACSKESEAAAEPALEKGPAYGKMNGQPGAAELSEWPTYRHDAARSGAVKCDVPAALTESWRAELKGKLTAPVIAGGKVFVFSVDSHTLHCLDADNGRRLWERTVSARVETPPTIHAGAALFGCRDGSVYCLRIDDGTLVWRFRAAPANRLIMDKGQLESAWPVNGSVLVIGSLAYFAAGRSSFLDGGICLYAVKPETGEVIHRTRVEGPWPDWQHDGGHPYWGQGSIADLLVTGEERKLIYMAQAVFDLNLQQLKLPAADEETGRREMGLHLTSQSGFGDHTWFHRTAWHYTRHWPGHTFGPAGPRSGQLLVFDEQSTYAVQAFRSAGRQGRFAAEERGYVLSADDNDEVVESEKFKIVRRRPPRWRQTLPLRGCAMVLAGDLLFVAGPPNVFPQDDPYAALEGRKGATLCAVSAKNGEALHTCQLDDAPVFDGMAAARSRLFICTQNGSVVCMAGTP